MLVPTEIEIIKDNIELVLPQRISAVFKRDICDVDGSLLLYISLMFRKLAICSLLSAVDTDAFFHRLSKSGHAYLYFLTSCHNNKAIDSYYFCASRAEPFLDALAANDLDTARKIALASSNTWAEEDEYEDDFCYFFFLMKLLNAGENSSDQLERILERFENALQGANPCRFNICRALHEKDTETFSLNLEALINERYEDLIRLRDKGLQPDPEIFETELYVSIEGIALIRLAKLSGMEVKREFKSIPSLALAPMKSPFRPPDSWKNVKIS